MELYAIPTLGLINAMVSGLSLSDLVELALNKCREDEIAGKRVTLENNLHQFNFELECPYWVERGYWSKDRKTRSRYEAMKKAYFACRGS